MKIRFGILITSDRAHQGIRPDQTIPLLLDLITRSNWIVIQSIILPDNREEIKDKLLEWSTNGKFDVILTSGGTGFSPRDCTPEATLDVVERMAPGLTETMRFQSFKINNHAMLSRGVAGIKSRVLIINLPGNPKGAVENFLVIKPVLEHAVELLNDDPDVEKHH